MPISRGATADGPNALSSAHVPGSYRAVLQAVCEEQAHDPYWALRDNWQDEVANMLHGSEEATKVAALVEQRRGQPVYFQRWQKPKDLQLRGLPHREQLFVVTPDDVVMVRPRQTGNSRPQNAPPAPP